MAIVSLSVLQYKDELAAKRSLIDELLTACDGWLHVDVIRSDMIPGKRAFSEKDIQLLTTQHAMRVYDLHLMVKDPVAFCFPAPKCRALITFHWEMTGPMTARILEQWREAGWETGLALQPNTAVKEVPDEVLRECRHILFMSVQAGKGGQSFQQSVIGKIAAFRSKYPGIAVHVDGGIKVKTMGEVDADVYVVGSAITNASDPQTAARKISREAKHDE
jgi:ribulose-phosphate 3-epimerase